MELYLNDSNINIDEFVNKYLKDVSVELKNNPKFKENLSELIKFITNKKNPSDSIPPFQLVVSEDGRAFEIRSGIRSDPDCLNERLQNNKRYNQVRFSLDERNNMEVLFSIGVFYKYDDFARNIRDDITASDQMKKLYDVSRSNNTPTVISVFHRHKVVLSNGIEICCTRYSDAYPLNCDFYDEKELRAETVIHSPRKWNYNVMPGRPSFEFNPSIINVYRFVNQLGVVHVDSLSGKDGTIQACECFATTEHPEKLGFLAEPIIICKNGQDYIPTDVQKMYPEMNVGDLEREMNLSFYRGIKTSETMRNNPDMAKELEKITGEGLMRKYNIDEEDLLSGKSR